MNAIVPAEQQPRLPTIVAGAPIRAIVPQDFEGAWRIASAVCRAGMAPKGLDSPEKAMVAILHGLEVGLTPMNALQSIAVVNGRPTVWGDGAIGLVRGSGLLEYMEERYEGTEGADTYAAICVVKRKGEPKPTTSRFSIADAKKAGLWGKAGPWTQYWRRMLQMRARAFVLRDGFADVLKGLGIKEEVEDYHNAPATASDLPPAPPPPPQIVHAVQEPPRSTIDETVEMVTAAAPAEAVEWADDDQPPAPPSHEESGVAATAAGSEGVRAQAAPPQHGEPDNGGAAAPAKSVPGGFTGQAAETLKNRLIADIRELKTVSDFLAWAKGAEVHIARLPADMQEAVRSEFNTCQHTVVGG